jgi:hypothetical protein
MQDGHTPHRHLGIPSQAEPGKKKRTMFIMLTHPTPVSYAFTLPRNLHLDPS